MNTKEKIIETSRTLFNELGFGAPTLHQVAQATGISRGNLTYYFKDKEVLLEAIVEEMWLKYKEGQLVATQFPSWNVIKKSIKVLHDIQAQYSFIFFDKQIFAHPRVQNILQRIESDSIKTQMSMFSFSIQIGNMQKEPTPGTYHNICKSIWVTAFYWHASKAYHPQRTGSWDDVMWSLLLPNFTEKGKKAFIEKFGEAYYHQLGTSLEAFEQEQIDF
ncbi:MAG: TetR/AcrR family transcriptional regulator [Bacteroidota bacterium]